MSVINAAALLICLTRKSDHITCRCPWPSLVTSAAVDRHQFWWSYVASVDCVAPRLPQMWSALCGRAAVHTALDGDSILLPQRLSWGYWTFHKLRVVCRDYAFIVAAARIWTSSLWRYRVAIAVHLQRTTEEWRHRFSTVYLIFANLRETVVKSPCVQTAT